MKTVSASRTAQRGSAGVRLAASQAISVTAIVTPPITRLPNSMYACAFFAGSGWPFSQPGQ